MSHKKTQTWTQGTTSCSRRNTGLQGVSCCLRGRGAVCVTLTLPSSALYSELPACFSSLCAPLFAQPTLLPVSVSACQAWLPIKPKPEASHLPPLLSYSGLLAPPQSKAIWDGLDLRHVSSCLCDTSYKLCLFSLHSALLTSLRSPGSVAGGHGQLWILVMLRLRAVFCCPPSSGEDH